MTEREPMTNHDRLLLVCIYAVSAVVISFILWAVYTFAVPWIADRVNEYIESRYQNSLSWTTGIIQESPLPRRVEYAGYTIEVWE